ncbi:hypothetical protein BDR05DRAFT_1055618 [Suillus weaverae]|nr:hypothetical protein BDR05DRAFT_1055618 [Suillus weaverae]
MPWQISRSPQQRFSAFAFLQCDHRLQKRKLLDALGIIAAVIDPSVATVGDQRGYQQLNSIGD